MQAIIWIRVGDGGDYSDFGDDLDAAIDWLNECKAGNVTGWKRGGLDTVNYWGQDYVSLYWGDEDANHLHDLDDAEKRIVAERLEEVYI